jgi:hypothetical protein
MWSDRDLHGSGRRARERRGHGRWMGC